MSSQSSVQTILIDKYLIPQAELFLDAARDVLFAAEYVKPEMFNEHCSSRLELLT